MLPPCQSILFGPERLRGCVASRRAALLSPCRASWMSHRLLSFSHCATLSSSCHTSWLSQCLSPSSRCATLSSSCCASLLSHHLTSSSCCAAHSSSHRSDWLLCQLLMPHLLVVLSSRHLIVSLSCRLVVLSSCRLVVLSSCRLVVLSSCRLVVLSSCRLVVLSSCLLVVSSSRCLIVSLSCRLSWKFCRFRCRQQLVLTTCFRVFPTCRPDTADVLATSCDVGLFFSVSCVVSLPNCRHVVT
jgi:hypothetical protein